MTGRLVSSVGLATPVSLFPDRTYEAIVFDWDGTAVTSREANAEPVRQRVEALCRAGVDVVVVSGTHLGNIDGQLNARPQGPGRLFLCLNRGSQVALVDANGPRFVWERHASSDEDGALDRAATLTVKGLRAHGLTSKIVSQRLNRRKIDIIPEPPWENPPKAQINELLKAVTARLSSHGLAGLDSAVAVAFAAAVEAGLDDPRITTDAKHLEIGLTDKSDSLHYVLSDLGHRGIGPGLVLIVGDELGSLGGVRGSDAAMLIAESARTTVISVGVEPEGVPEAVIHLPGGPEIFLSLLDNQIARRAVRRVPSIDLDPSWMLAWSKTEPKLERVRESLFTVSNGRIGTRGYREEDGATTNPMVIASGIYENRDGMEGYLIGPRWGDLEIENTEDPDTWVLDLHTGVLMRTRASSLDTRIDFRSIRFASLTHPGTMALRAEGGPDELRAGLSLITPKNDRVTHGTFGHVYWASCESSQGGGITAAANTTTHTTTTTRLIQRIAHFHADPQIIPDPEIVSDHLTNDMALGFDSLLTQHRQAWANRWADAEVSIANDPEAELAVRFALFHLMSNVADQGSVGVGARGLSGSAYAGHVFWDAEVFILPFLAATHAPAAEAMLNYRLDRLETALNNAATNGYLGARFPWESARTGEDVTPRSARDAHGKEVAILTGQAEEHIVSDIAWATWHTAAWTGDYDFLHGPGRSLLIETARYWASRVERDGDGSAHLRGVIGPDEYHELVDDNAFTNVMAKWNLRQAARLVEDIIARNEPVEVAPVEITSWREVADALVDGYDPETGIYEQFKDFASLEPLIINELASPPVAADILLGHDRVAGSQVIKQADVLMLHHLVPEACEPGSLRPNLDYYGPRTAHGSSLSPAIHAGLLARAGQANEALEYFRLACRIDLDDLTETTAGGLHMACLGGIWQALAYGFVGLWPDPDGLTINPHLPDAWQNVSITVVFRGTRVTIKVEADDIAITPFGNIEIIFKGQTAITVRPPGMHFTRTAKGWAKTTS